MAETKTLDAPTSCHLNKVDGHDVESHAIPVSNEAQVRICKSFDRRLLPLVCSLYVLSYVDRGNIGNAKTAGMAKDLHLNDSQWTWVLSKYFLRDPR